MKKVILNLASNKKLNLFTFKGVSSYYWNVNTLYRDYKLEDWYREECKYPNSIVRSSNDQNSLMNNEQNQYVYQYGILGIWAIKNSYFQLLKFINNTHFLLWTACHFGNLKLVKRLVRDGIKIHPCKMGVCNSSLNFPLCCASRQRHFKIVKFLVENRIHGNVLPLCCAGAGGSFKIIKYLVSKGANIHNEVTCSACLIIFDNVQHKYPNTLLHDVCCPNNYWYNYRNDVIFRLFEEQYTRLFEKAIGNSKIAICDYKGIFELENSELYKSAVYLAEKGIDIQTLFQFACRYEIFDIIIYLVEKFKNLNSQLNLSVEPLFEKRDIVELRNTNNSESKEDLIDRYGKISAEKILCYKECMDSFYIRRVIILKYLIENGAEFRYPGVLYSAIRSGSFESIQFLVENKVPFPEDNTCVTTAIDSGFYRTVRYAIENGMNYPRDYVFHNFPIFCYDKVGYQKIREYFQTLN